MHFHLPKPIHGWRGFAGEVGIIVVGVLIALGAEQIVETIHWREQTRATREALYSDAVDNLGAAKFRQEHSLVSSAGWSSSQRYSVRIRLDARFGFCSPSGTQY